MAVSTDFSFHGHDTAHDIVKEAEHVNGILGEGAIKSIVYVGACCGYEAGLLQGVYPDAEIIAIEAVEESYLRYFGKDRSCCPMSIHALNATISHRDGLAELKMARLNTQHSLLDPHDWGVTNLRTVNTFTLDTVCNNSGIQPDMLVLDVEGIPGRALIGAGPGVLSRLKVVMAETEPAGANVFEDGDTDEFVDRILHIYGLTRVLCSVPPPPVRQLNSVWVRLPK